VAEVVLLLWDSRVPSWGRRWRGWISSVKCGDDPKDNVSWWKPLHVSLVGWSKMCFILNFNEWIPRYSGVSGAAIVEFRYSRKGHSLQTRNESRLDYLYLLSWNTEQRMTSCRQCREILIALECSMLRCRARTSDWESPAYGDLARPPDPLPDFPRLPWILWLVGSIITPTLYIRGWIHMGV